MSFPENYSYNIDMPYVLSHASFAYTVGQRLGCFTDRESLSLFMLGCLGPDIFFYDRLPPTPFVPNRKIIGNQLHRIPCDRVVRNLLSESTKPLMPYVYGFFTHIALDSTVHPYVCALHSGLDHTRFEGEIDSILYRRFKDSIPFEDLFQKPSSLSELDSLVSRMCSRTLEQNIPGVYERCAKKMFRLFPLLFDPDGKRFKPVQKVEHFLGIDNALSGFLLAAERSVFEDCMNDRHTVWHAVTFPDVPRTESVDELFSDASVLADSMILSAQSGDYAEAESLSRNRTMSDGPIPCPQ